MPLLDLPAATPLLQLGFINSTVSALQLTSTVTKVATVFLAPKAGNITALGFRIGNVTSGQSTRVSLQTVGTDRLPAGTNLSGSTTGTFTPLANTSFTVSLSATVTLGQRLAMVREWDSAAGTTVQFNYVAIARAPSLPYSVTFVSGAWGSPVALTDGFFVRYDDGSEYMVGFAAATCIGTSYNNTSGARLALKYRYPLRHRLCGAALYNTSTVADFDLRLYDAGGTQLISEAHLASDFAAAAGMALFPFSTPQIVAANTDVYLALVPGTANNMQVVEATLLDAKHRNFFPLGTTMCKSLYTTASGTWIDSTSVLPFIAPLIDQLDSGNVFVIDEE